MTDVEQKAQTLVRACSVCGEWKYDRDIYSHEAFKQEMSDALKIAREALENAPIIGLTESAVDFRKRQDLWAYGQWKAAIKALQELLDEIERLEAALKRIAGGWPKPMQLARETLEKKK